MGDLNDKIAFNNKGAELCDTGDYKEGEKYFRQAHEADPSDPVVCYNIGFCILKNRSTEEDKDIWSKQAVRWFDKAVTNAEQQNLPSQGAIAYDCGLSCYEAQLYNDAERYYTKAEPYFKEDAGYWNSRGVLCFVTNCYAPACDYFEKAISFDPNFLDSWFNLADTYEALGDIDKANTTRMKYLELEKEQLG